MEVQKQLQRWSRNSNEQYVEEDRHLNLKKKFKTMKGLDIFVPESILLYTKWNSGQTQIWKSGFTLTKQSKDKNKIMSINEIEDNGNASRENWNVQDGSTRHPSRQYFSSAKAGHYQQKSGLTLIPLPCTPKPIQLFL